VRVWDADTGRDAFAFPGHTAPVRGVAFHPASRWLASSSEDTAIKIWDLRTGREAQKLIGQHASAVRCVVFSGDGRRLFSASADDTAKIWDVATGQEVLTLRGHSSSVWGVAISRNIERLATASLDKTQAIWERHHAPDDTHQQRATADITKAVVKIWDGRPWTPDAADEREALGRLDFLFARPLPPADVVADLKDSAVLRPRAREIALSLVDRYREETDPEAYHRASWALVRQTYLNAFQYRFALLQAEHACRLLPGKGKYMTTLGAAYYRAGHDWETIETMEKADRLDKDSPAALAFLAMAHHRLGRHDQARAVLARLRALLDEPHRAQGAEALDLMHAAEALIAPPWATTER
jgi:hypothetical protein